eukprot:CAMPEP_0114588076 /NCGR_PEP_ID=MMETSP0125-20121206/10876_1 /TAXON_ID=485358 ORGANISM="Aristerostoma sp., Strain ATCC 50986" /NCGR_SAMPLE_ID=MMETSP0125 /ASSEMBLY_ACC=CAM_ASM_000245 /LENGTH=160 /DNA_ID=CAMNT_0001784305 /DNA_START=238 /DNA_END=720 /DNA_ORIENTATION=-
MKLAGKATDQCVSKSDSIDLMNSSLHGQILPDFKGLRKLIEKQSKSIDSLKEVFEKLDQVESAYEAEQKDMESQQSKLSTLLDEKHRLEHELAGSTSPKECVRCRNEFLPLDNEEGACHYHPGRLLFYSCKGCGADEYYSCCNRCSKCSKGCREGKHASE